MRPESLLDIASEIDSQSPGTVTVHLGGKLGQMDVKRFRSEVERLVTCGYRRIDVDLSELQYIDSSGLAELVPIYQSVRETDGVLRLSNPRRLIRHILLSAHLNDILEIYPQDETK
jgi:anti-sigma B factor antagonist